MMTKSLNLIERATWMGALFVLFAFFAQFAAAAEPMLYAADGTACVALDPPGPSAVADDEESIIVQRQDDIWVQRGKKGIIVRKQDDIWVQRGKKSIIVQRPATDQELMSVPACSW